MSTRAAFAEPELREFSPQRLRAGEMHYETEADLNEVSSAFGSCHGVSRACYPPRVICASNMQIRATEHVASRWF